MSGNLMIRLNLKELVLFVLLIVTLISLCIALTINFHPLYTYFVYHQNLGPKAGISNHQLLLDYRRLLAYLNYPFVSDLKLGLPVSFSAMHHFKEVKALFLKDYLVLIVGLPISGYWLRKLWLQGRFFVLIRGCYYTIATAIVLLTIMVANFADFFVFFHELLFNNQDWLFDPKLDPIINALPASYFLACFSLFLILFVFSLVVLILLAKWQLKNYKFQQK